jgi:hypothetical protein
MDTHADPIRDPVSLLAALDADELKRRLDDLIAEEQAIRTLLYAARARERAARRREAGTCQ